MASCVVRGYSSQGGACGLVLALTATGVLAFSACWLVMVHDTCHSNSAQFGRQTQIDVQTERLLKAEHFVFIVQFLRHGLVYTPTSRVVCVCALHPVTPSELSVRLLRLAIHFNIERTLLKSPACRSIG